MNGETLTQLELLSQVDNLLEDLRGWTAERSSWEPLRQSQALVRRVVERTESLRKRLAAPLVVATFGGTGTGKSALVNALVGQESTPSGRERPTTRKPIMILHPETSLDSTDLNPADFEIKRIVNPLFESIILIDCPDPDTNEQELVGSNLERLHRLLPHCDVLIYVTTQQKYHSARVNQELALASAGCRLVLVQTNADLDVDIRDDWKKLLSAEYQVAGMYLVDSLTALKQQQSGQELTGDFARLREFLLRELSVSRHLLIRRENLLDLVQTALDHARRELDQELPSLTALETVLEQQCQRLIGLMGGELKEELLTHQRLWERRLLGVLSDYWGFSPFSTALRLYNGLGGFLASASLMRARSSAQVAVIGALQGVRWLSQRRQEKDADDQLERLATLGLDDAALRESQVLIAGYVQDARLLSEGNTEASLETLRREASRIEGRFLGNAAQRMDELIEQLARQQRWNPAGMICEGVFSLFLVYLLARIGKNFFWDSAFTNIPILDLNFYIPAAIFTTLLAGILIALFTRQVRGELIHRVTTLATEMAHSRMGDGLFPQIEQECASIQNLRNRLLNLISQAARIRQTSPGNLQLTGRDHKPGS